MTSLSARSWRLRPVALAGIAAAVIAGATTIGSAAPQAKGSGIVVGRVVDADSEKPISGAIVILSVIPAPLVQRQGTSSASAGPGNQGSAQNPQTRVLADGDGQFAFRGVSAGRCRFLVQAQGYSGGGYGQVQPGGPSQELDLGDGQRVGDVKLKMWKDAVITGRVMDEAGEPVVGVLVRVLRRTVVNGQVTLQRSTAGRNTDDRGAYRSAGIEPGDYVVEVPSTSTTMPIATLDAADQQPQGDSAGNVVGTFVGGLLSGGRSGQQVGDLLLVNGGLQGVGAGTVAPPAAEDGRLSAYPTMFYPAATVSTRASVITLHSGEEKSGVDIQLALVPAFLVSGTLTDLDGSPASNLAIRVVALDEQSNVDATPDYVAMTVSGSRGEFTILAVPTGQYMLNVLRAAVVAGARGGGPPTTVNTAPPAWAKAPVSIGGQDIVGLSLTLHGALKVTGHVAFDGTSLQPTGAQLTRGIQLRPVGPNGPGSGRAGGAANMTAQINPDGSFMVNGAMPGPYMIAAPGWPALKWIAKSINVEGHDRSDIPFDLDTSDLSNVVVTFTDRPGALAGTVLRTTGELDATALVVGFPADAQGLGPSGLHIFSTHTTSNGTYAVPSMAPGDYYVAAVSDTLAQTWQDPDVLSRLAMSAARVHIDDGAHVTRDLTTSIVR